MRTLLAPAVRLWCVLTLLTGVLYPALLTGIGKALFADAVSGQLLRQKDGRVVGSRLLAQKFSSPRYFKPRPSAGDYELSQGTHWPRFSRELAAATQHPGPAELNTRSASGLDPHLTWQGIEAQLPEVAAARGLAPEKIRGLIQTVSRSVPLRDPLLNVLEVNLLLDQLLEHP